MGSIIRLIVVFGKVAITIIVVAVILYLTFLLINRVFRYFVDAMGYEALDLLEWTKARFPKLKKKEKTNEENSVG